ncbi:MAG: gliding motility-associated C-terminal domain-containing protein [Chitinophagaceae bacterium]|nr:gliding motility-associated C-terminal domain-containing protein [Chitinophagaceae bacterium]
MHKLYTVFILLVIPAFLHAQCSFTVSTFPYNESFETSTGGWVSGGTNNDWAWGAPSKSFITNAGAGTKCWVTGGLTGSFYSYSERSYVYSPCFNFSTILKPHVKFKIYWDGENTYDGTVFQYSLNNGATWNNVGSYLDPTDCLNQNWYNQSNIVNLNTLASPKHGWAGTVLPTQGSCVGGSGSAGWVTASHCMNYLAGEPNVMFRFAFGAGSNCNDFDGFAFDDITIGEAPIQGANFSFVCDGTSLGYQYTLNAPCATSWVWNFDDPASGLMNTSTSQNPSHQFTNPGTYNVTCVVQGPCNTQVTIINQINTLNLNIATTNLLCYGVDIGTITASAQNSGGATVYYNLQPNNITNNNGFFNNLAATAYNVSYLNTQNCLITKNVSIYTPVQLVYTSLVTSAVACSGQSNASITATVNGGVNPKNYTILPGGTTNNNGVFASLAAGTYTVLCTDANGCTISSSITVAQTTGISVNTLSTSNVLCYGASTGSAIITLNGSGAINYQLMPGSITNTNGVFNNIAANAYTITATDANGCTATTAFTITQAPSMIFDNIQTTNAKCVPPNSGTLDVSASNGVGQIQYSIGSGFNASGSFTNLTTGVYTITIQDGNNCTLQTTTLVGSEPLPVIQVENVVQPSCSPNPDGSIDVLATATVPIQSYTLLPANITSATGYFTNLSAGTYTIRATDMNGCVKDEVVTLNTPGQMSIAQLLVDNDSCTLNLYNKVTCLVNGGSGTKTYRITPGSLVNNTGVFYNLEPDHYYIQVKDSLGCTAVSEFDVAANECCNKPYVANAFSPNGDGLNDEVRVHYFPGISIEKFIIMNRYGQEVFSSQHEEDRWDGKFKSNECEIGTYYYMIRFKCNKTREIGILKGDVMLVR